MNTNDQPSVNYASEHASQLQLSNKNKKDNREDLPGINEQGNGCQTSTPARPNVNEPQVTLQNPEPAGTDAKHPEGFKLSRNMMIGLGALILILVAASITMVVIYLTRGFEVREEGGPTTINVPNSDASIVTKELTVKDPQTFNSNAPLKLYAQTVSRRGIRRIPRRNNRKGDEDADENRLLEQEKQEKQKQHVYTSLTFKDQMTDSHFSLQSDSMQLRASFNVPVILATVINSLQPQDVPEATRSLQQSNTQTSENEATLITKTFTFNNIGEQITNNLKENLKKSDANVMVSQQVTHNLEYKNQSNAYQFVPGVQSPSAPSEDIVTLFDPAAIPAVSDPNNQAQLAKAVGQVMKNMLDKAKSFYLKRGFRITKSAEFQLLRNDPSHGATSFYLDQPADIGKACIPTGQNSQQCENKIIGSNLLNVAEPKQNDNIVANTNVIVHVDF